MIAYVENSARPETWACARSELANRTLANLLPGQLAPRPFRSLALSFPGHFAPWNFRSVALSLQTVKITIYCDKKFIQRNHSNLKHAVERAT